jgi:hypothetical protein
MKYKQTVNKFKVHLQQKLEIEKYFNCFKCEANRHKLKCKGILQPFDFIEPYSIQIEYTANSSPVVYVKSPNIPINVKAHMYSKGNLCLYYPREFKWKNETSISKYLIPWISEWIVYYENFKMNGGIWLGPEAPHLPTDKK